RVLDSGFIDGEMKVYRPDVARVGVGSQNHATEVVSVKCNTRTRIVTEAVLDNLSLRENWE
ncbi:hypothetical protein KI387_033447, partial [Taxus chinensis]